MNPASYNLLRDCYGKILGRIDEFVDVSEDESYHDEKVLNVRFPKHNKDMNGDVHTWNLYSK